MGRAGETERERPTSSKGQRATEACVMGEIVREGTKIAWWIFIFYFLSSIQYVCMVIHKPMNILNVYVLLPCAYFLIFFCCLAAHTKQSPCVHNNFATRLLVVLFFTTCAALIGVHGIHQSREKNACPDIMAWLAAYFLLCSGGILVLCVR